MKRRLVLVGAGHTHSLVLLRWAELPLPPATEVTVVVDDGRATYSGMVPGVVAGDYSLAQAQIAVRPLAERIGARLVVRPALRVDPSSRTIETGGGDPVEFDIASIDVGSTVRGIELPGVTGHALATRPIGRFADTIDDRLRSGGSIRRVAIVGGGAAGVELAFTLRGRFEAAGLSPEIVVACGRDGLLKGYAAAARRIVQREAAARDITLAATTDASFVDARGVGFETGHLAAELVVWATGAASPPCVADSPLPHDARGFVRVHPTLEVLGTRGLLACGDCASIDVYPWVPKAGVHAVRQAPVVDANLRALLTGSPLREYRPQRHFLSLMNLGRRRALATKWGLAAAGSLAWIAKDRIDRRFVDGFR
jgi:selenide,water dikinase